MTENIGEGCLYVTIVICIGILIGGIFVGLIDSFIDKKHCRNCGQVVKYENYCPNCGTKTDSVLVYDFWDKIKYGR